MKKRIIVLLISLLSVVWLSAGAFAEEYDLTAEAPQDAQVGWGVFSLPEDLKPQSFEPSDRTDPTDSLPAPLTGNFPLPDTITNDYPAASSRSPEEIENEILERCLETGPVPLISTVPVPYIPIGKIDTNYWQ